MADLNDRYLEDLLGKLDDLRDTIRTTSEDAASRSERARDRAEKGDVEIKSAIKEATRSLREFNNAILDPRAGLDKYARSLETAGEAISRLPLPEFLKKTVEGLTALTVATIKQTHSTLGAADELAKFGAIGSITAKELLNLAQQAGYSSHNIQELSKITKATGADILVLGRDVNESTRNFLKLTEANEEQLQTIRKLGITQTEFNQRQSEYIKLQAASGRSLTFEVADRAKLRKTTDDYVLELAALSKLTGETAENIASQQRQMLAQDDLNARVAGLSAERYELEQQRIKLEKEGNTVRAQELESRINTINKEAEALRRLAPVVESLDPKTAAGIKTLLATGGIPTTQEAGQLLAARPEIKLLIDEFKKTNDPGKFAQGLAMSFQRTYRQFGGENQLLQVAPEAREFFQASAKNATFMSKFLDVKGPEDLNKVIDQFRQAGDVADDPARKTQATIESLERRVRVAVDKMVMEFNPFISGLTASTVVVVAFTAALAKATIALASGSIIGAIKNLIPGVLAGGAVGAGSLGKIVKGGGILGGVLAGVGAIGGIATANREAEQARKEGVKTEEQINRELNEKRGEQIGQAVGSIGGALAGGIAGAKLGASMGTILGLPGAAIGGVGGTIIGGLIGGIGGNVGGGAIGRGVSGSGSSEAPTGAPTTGPDEIAPPMAKGGITQGISIAGEAGPEAVVPLPGNRKIPVDIRDDGELRKAVTGLSKTVSSLTEPIKPKMAVAESGPETPNIPDDIRDDEKLRNTVIGLSQTVNLLTGREKITEPTTRDKDSLLTDPLKPKMAMGGIATRPSVAGEAGPEAVVPLPGNRKIPVELKSNSDDGANDEAMDKLSRTFNSLSGVVATMSGSVKMMSDSIKTQTELYEKLNDQLEDATDPNKQGVAARLSSWKDMMLGAVSRFFGGTGAGASPSAAPGSSGGMPNRGVSSTPAGYLQRVAVAESSGKPGVSATSSSAAGLFQFTKDTWESVTKQMGKEWSLQDRFDPEKSTQAAQYLTDINRSELERNLGKDRQFSDTDLYMAHFLGSAGASKFLKAMDENPGASAKSVVGDKAIDSNPGIFYRDPRDKTSVRTLEEVYNVMAGKMQRAGAAIASGKVPETIQEIPKTVKGPSADNGGIVSGPSTGFPVIAHGNEAIIPLEGPGGKKTGDLLNALNAVAGLNKTVAAKTVSETGVTGMQADLLESGASKLAGRVLNQIPGMQEIKTIAGGANTINAIANIVGDKDMSPGSKTWQVVKNLTGFMGPKGKILQMAMEGAEALYARMSSDTPKPINAFNPTKTVENQENMGSPATAPTPTPTPIVAAASAQPNETAMVEEIMRNMLPMLDSKLDAMIEKLGQSVDIQDQQLRYTR